MPNILVEVKWDNESYVITDEGIARRLGASFEVSEVSFPKEWAKIVQFIKYMRDELPSEAKFADFVTLFHYLVG